MAVRGNFDALGDKQSGHRKESQDLAHHAIALIGLEKKLSVRGTIQNDQFLWIRSFFILRANTRKPWAGFVRVIAGDDEEDSRLQLFRREVRRAPRSTMRSTSPGMDLIDASPAAPPPKLPPTTETVLTPCVFK